MEGFLVTEKESEDDEDAMNIEDSDVVQEVSSRTILHWNYRGLLSLPPELLSI